MLPCVFTVIASLAPSYLSLRRKRFWVDDWDDGVNFSNNPLLFGAFAAGTERNSTALAGILRETWRPRVVLGVWEPVADTAKVAYASALGFSNIIHDASPPGAPECYAALAAIIHSANAILLQVLCRRLLSCVRPTSHSAHGYRSSSSSSCSWAAAISSSLWAAHPLRTEAVGWLSCLPYNLASLFVLLSVHSFISAHPTMIPSTLSKYLWTLSSRLSFGFSALCKAPALALPLSLLVLDVVLHYIRPAVGAQEPNPTHSTLRAALRAAWRNADLLALMVAFAAAAHIANVVNNGSGGSMYHSEREDWWEKLHSNQYLWAGDVLSPIQVLLRAMAALHWYPCTSLFPHGLAMIYPVPKGWPATGGVQLFSVGFAAIATLCSLAMAARSGQQLMFPRQRHCQSVPHAVEAPLVVWYGAAWAASSALLLPTLGFVQHGWPVLVADRYSHLACMVWALPMAGLIEPAIRIGTTQKLNGTQGKLALGALHRSARAVVGFTLLLVLALVLQSSWASMKWRSSADLWSHAAFVHPRDCTATYNLGCALERAAKANPLDLLDSPLLARNRDGFASKKNGTRTATTHEERTALAVALQSEAMREAEALFARASELEPTYGAAYNNRGQLAERRGGDDGMRVAEDSYRHAIALNANTHYKAYNNLASLLHRQGASLRGKGNEQSREVLFGDAEDNYRKAIAIFPSYHLALFNLATLLHTTGRHWSKEAESFSTATEDALDLYRASIRANPSMAESHFNYASLSLTVLHDGGRQMNDRIETNTALLLQITEHLEATLQLQPTHRAAVDTLNYVRLLEARGRRQ
jgi:tetratricopeptide (TPR) repeat protein